MFGPRELSTLETWLDELYLSNQHYICNGVSKDMRDYGERVGYLRAIRDVGEKLKDIVKKQELPEQSKGELN